MKHNQDEVFSSFDMNQMKPQCETTADCYIELGRVMNEFELSSHAEVLRKGYALFNGKLFEGTARDNQFGMPELWSFAIAKLEDKPVFLGDELYCTRGRYFSCERKGSNKVIVTEKTCFNHLSWTPPKQTVTIKVGGNEPVEVEKVDRLYTVYCAGSNSYMTAFHHDKEDAAEQFRKAMKPLVKE